MSSHPTSSPVTSSPLIDVPLGSPVKNDIVELRDGRGYTTVTIHGTTWTKAYFDLREAVSEAAVLGLLTRLQMLHWLYRREQPQWLIEPSVLPDPKQFKAAGFLGEPAQAGIIFARGDQAAVLIELDSKPWLCQFPTHHDAADAVRSMGLISQLEASFASEHLMDWCPGFYDFPLTGGLTSGDLVEHGFQQRV